MLEVKRRNHRYLIGNKKYKNNVMIKKIKKYTDIKFVIIYPYSTLSQTLGAVSSCLFIVRSDLFLLWEGFTVEVVSK